MTDSPELAEARSAVDVAVRKFVELEAKERHGFEDVFVVASVSYAEYVTSQMVKDDATATAVIVPDSQHRSTTRGLFELGCDIFRA